MPEFDLEEYFLNHPDEEEEFIEEMARLRANDEPVEIPEDWSLDYADAR